MDRQTWKRLKKAERYLTQRGDIAELELERVRALLAEAERDLPDSDPPEPREPRTRKTSHIRQANQNPPIVASCTVCEAMYSEEEWDNLTYIGSMAFFSANTLHEYRNCTCGSTLTLVFYQLEVG